MMRKHVVAVIVFFLLWPVLGILAWLLVRADLGPWIELFNGATWPALFLPDSAALKPDHGFLFYVVLSLRTLLNLGVVFAAAVAAYLVFTGRLGELLMSKLNSVYRTSNLMLLEQILQLLEDSGVTVPLEVEEKARKVAKEFGDSDATSAIFRDRVKNAAGTSAH